MTTPWRLVPWLNRLILLAPLVIIAVITARIITDPVRSAAEHGMTLDSPVGLTNYRSGNGGIFLAFAIFTISCLVFTRRHLTGLSFLALMMGVVLAVRGVSVVIDGTLREQLSLLVAEAVFLTLSVVGVFLELARRHRLGNSGG
jgi:hypothetical protein